MLKLWWLTDSNESSPEEYLDLPCVRGTAKGTCLKYRSTWNIETCGLDREPVHDQTWPMRFERMTKTTWPPKPQSTVHLHSLTDVIATVMKTCLDHLWDSTWHYSSTLRMIRDFNVLWPLMWRLTLGIRWTCLEGTWYHAPNNYHLCQKCPTQHACLALTLQTLTDWEIRWQCSKCIQHPTNYWNVMTNPRSSFGPDLYDTALIVRAFCAFT